jgi:lipoprotein-anchoring transpeptidase ErfK/SrfK
MQHKLKKGLPGPVQTIPKKGVKSIVVVLKSQTLAAYTANNVVFEFGCVCGDAQHPTPKGRFRIIKKERIYRSKTYNAQMNYALQITTSGIFIHESYNFVDDPRNQNLVATIVSDTTAATMSRMRSWFPQLAEADLKVGNINLVGSHGCIRLAHSDAVKLFDWADRGISVEVK